jgi:erythromycin esterase
MSEADDRDVVAADYIRERAVTLATIDPYQDLDDLEPLREMIGDAQVIGVGENAHFVEEFSSTRERILRFLAERCGFTVFAFEFSFAEAFALDRWLHDDARTDLAEVSENAADWGAADLMHWLRKYNRTSGYPLRFVGIDLPEAGGALRPALEPVAAYLHDVDADAQPLTSAALQVSDSFLVGIGSGAAAAPAWARLDTANQDALTASLARLQLRMQALESLYVSRSDQRSYDIARCHLTSACHTDYMFRAMHGHISGGGMSADMSVRENFMAGTLHWHLQHSDPGTRLVVAAHNNHIQKTPVTFGQSTIAVPMGQILHRKLGRDYLAIALTHTDDHVPEMYPDENNKRGFTLRDIGLEFPQPGSIERALLDAGFGDAISITDLRRSWNSERGEPLLTEIRTQSAVQRTHLGEAFDAVLAVPTVTRDRTVRFWWHRRRWRRQPAGCHSVQRRLYWLGACRALRQRAC